MLSTIKSSDNKKQTLLEQLYYKYKFLMFHVAFTVLQDYGLAEDAVHSSFLKLTNYSFKIDKVSCNKTKAFLVIVTRNVAIDILKKKNKENAKYINDELLDLVDNNLLPLDFVIHNESINIVQKAIDTLDHKYSDVLLLKYFYDYSDAEIALLLSISREAVRVRLHRAKKKLADILIKGDIRS
jgi:RNA polymerase sigma-70 factor, ECF subfamily